MTAIIKDGANCIVIKHRYLNLKRIYGENHDDTKFDYLNYKDCLKMKRIRLNTLQTLNKKFSILKDKVNKLQERKKLSIRKADIIKHNIKNIKSTLNFVMENNEL